MFVGDKCALNRRRSNNKPGWADHAADKYNVYKECFYMWRTNGKPHCGSLFDRYYQSKLSFKSAIRYIKRNEGRIKADKLASSLFKKDFDSFWKSIKSFNRRKIVLPHQIGDACGEGNISNLWKTHYETLYNSVPNSADVTYHDAIVPTSNITICFFTLPQFVIAVNQLNSSKASGLDRISAEHLKYCSLTMLNVICVLFNGFFVTWLSTTEHDEYCCIKCA